jgi:diguanylate cyclase (GGDEF)-like protein/PAS domain S-box-containing protein
VSALPGYQELLSELGIGVVVVGIDGGVIDSNRRARELIRMPPGFTGPLNAYDAVHDVLDEHERVIPLQDLPIVRAFRSGASVRGVVVGFRVKGDASTPVVWLLMAAHIVSDPVTGQVTKGICTFVDITAQRAARTAVTESERRFRLLAENAADMIFRARVAPERRFEYVNPAAQRLLGYEPDEFYADFDLAFRIMHPDDRRSAEARFESLIRRSSDEVASLMVRLTRRDGATVWTEFRMVPILEAERVVAFEGIVRDITEVKVKEADLSYRALHDPLTGLPNRRLLLDALEAALARTRLGNGTALAVLYVDLDRFKTVNDNLGHGAGDRVLTTVGIRIADTARRSDCVARLGGDEFAAVLPGLHDEREAVRVAHTLLEAISVPVPLDEADLVTTASIGLAYTADGTETPAELLRRADLAMYRAKDRGRARVESYQEPDSGTDPCDHHG